MLAEVNPPRGPAWGRAPASWPPLSRPGSSAHRNAARVQGLRPLTLAVGTTIGHLWVLPDWAGLYKGLVVCEVSGRGSRCMAVSALWRCRCAI
jgi:hypothetical protein